MATTTSDQGLALPSGGDAANLPTAMTNYNAGVENRLNKRYTSRADRTARDASPNAGELSFLADLKQHEYAVGASWLELRPLVAVKAAETQTLTSNTTLTNDDTLALALQIGRYDIELDLLYDTSAAGDFKWAFTYSGTVGDNCAAVWGLDVASTVNNGAQRLDGSVAAVTTAFTRGGIGIGTFLPIQYRTSLRTTVAGTLQLQWAQSTSDATATRVKIGSLLKATRMA